MRGMADKHDFLRFINDADPVGMILAAVDEIDDIQLIMIHHIQ